MANGWRDKAGLPGLVAAEAISTLGGRMSFMALPWLVLVTTGSPVKVGIVAAAETLPYVLSGVLAAPLQDRLGARRTSIFADAGNCLVVGAVALWANNLGTDFGFGVLLVMVALAGALSSQASRSKNNTMKALMDAAGTNFLRVSSFREGILRSSNVIGASAAGFAIAVLGATGAIWLNAASFGLAAILFAVFVPRLPEVDGKAPQEPYVTALRNGWGSFKDNRLIRAITNMLFFTNLFNQAAAVVFVPLWVLTVMHSPEALGSVAASFALGVIAGSVIFGVLGPYLPRYSALVFGYVVGGPPRFLVLALSDDLVTVIAVTFISGMCMCSVNPTIGATIFQRVPSDMLARVGGLIIAVSYAGIPIGSIVGGLMVEQFGLINGILLASVIYTCVTLTPVVGYRIWRELNDIAKLPTPDGSKPLPRLYKRVRSTLGPRINLRYADGSWSVRVRHGLRRITEPQRIEPKVAVNALAQLSGPEVHDVVQAALTHDAKRTKRDASILRSRLSHLDELASGLEKSF